MYSCAASLESAPFDFKKLKELVNELDEKHKSNFDLIMKDFESIDIFSW